MKIYCCACCAEIDARLTNGKEVYPHRRDLWHIPFWRCDKCKNYVGCHYKTKNPTKPLGTIPSADIRKTRMAIHGLLDPLWKEGLISRGKLYQKMSARMGMPSFHTALLSSEEEAMKAYAIAVSVRTEIRKKAGIEQEKLF